MRVAMMDSEEYERRQEELARHAESEGAWYYDPTAHALEALHPRAGAVLAAAAVVNFPPSLPTLMEMQRRRGDKSLETLFVT